MKKGTKRAASKSRNGTLTLNIPGTRKAIEFSPEDAGFLRRFAEKETNGDLQAMLEKVVSEANAIRNEPETPPNLQTVVEYEICGIHDTADICYWGGRWPDDFFLARKLSGEPPKLTPIADVFAWIANIEEVAGFSTVGVEYIEQNLHILYRAASLELRLDPTPECANTREKYDKAKAAKNGKN